MTKHATRDASGYDYGYRPSSYFGHLDPNTLIVASILGEERRKDVQERLASGNFDPLVWGPWITESKLDDATRKLIGQAHPRFMGASICQRSSRMRLRSPGSSARPSCRMWQASEQSERGSGSFTASSMNTTGYSRYPEAGQSIR